jgi:alpha-2-macroglobulin
MKMMRLNRLRRASLSLAPLLLIAATCVPTEPEPIDAEPARPAPSARARPAERPGSVTLAGEPRLGMPIGQVVLGPDRKLPIEVQRTRLARIRLAPITPADLPAAAPIAGVHPVGSDPLAKLPRAIRSRVKAHPIEETGDAALELDVFEKARAELVLGVLEAPGAMPRVGIFQKGELGVLLKIGDRGGLVWVTSTRSGKPVAGAEVVIQQGATIRHRTRTDASGIARLPAEKQLRIPYVAGAAHQDFDQPLIAVARSGKQLALASERWSSGLEQWQFGLPSIYYSGQDAIRGTVSAERGIYRPGDSVHVLGVLRQKLANGKLAPPPGTTELVVTDPDGNQVHSEKLALSAFGTFRAKLPIAKSARLGRYTIVATKGTSTLRSSFEVGEYRPVRFEVTLPPRGSADSDAKPISLPVSAQYLYGAPVAGGSLSWSAVARPRHEFGAWSEGYSFVAAEHESELLEVGEGEATLDASGRATISLPRASLEHAALDASQALEVVFEASVKDAAGDVVTGHGTQSILRADALVGLRSDSWVVEPSRGWSVKLVVAGQDGAPRSGKRLNLRLLRKKWVSVAEATSGAARYHGEWQDELVATRTLMSGAQPLDVHFPISAGGQYRLEASLDGRSEIASESVWAYGNDAYGGSNNDSRMALHADKSSYRPGERAKLYAEVPYAKAWALVTLEREGVLEARAQKLDGSGTPIEIALGAEQLPNVFASVAVVPAELGGKTPAVGVPLRVGYKELVISAEERRLKVDVRPATARSRPGESVDVRVRVSDHAGKPVHAEVTLWAADEGVLKLTGYATPDPFAPAYARHAHQVRTSASLLRLVTEVGDEWDEYGGDDDPGAEPGAAFRSRFLGTAFFSGGVVTNAKGEASVKIPLPDNLTRWRVMAAVADSGQRFGSAQTAIETSKPLQIEPALPRFLTRGDALDATVMVHNQTSARGSAEVRLDVSGAELGGDAVQQVELEPGAQAPVRFSLRANRIGTVRVRASATLGPERDGFQIELPVHAPTIWQTELIGEGRLDEARKLELEIPPSAEPGLAELVINVAPGVLASIGGSVDSLLEYPHGCVEQTTSRLIPMVLLEEILRSSGDPRLAGKEHRNKLEQAVAHVLKHQNGDGGFGLWPSSESEGFLTAYALWGLLTARDHGYPVPDGAFRRGVAYLGKHARQGDDMHGQFAPEDTAPFSAFVLAAAQQDDAGLGAKLAGDRKKLTRFGLGLLGAAYAERDRMSAAPLLAELAGARKKRSSGALIEDASSTSSALFEYGRDLRATAATVRALALSGNAKQADDLIAGILGERRKDGSWGTTYNNLWALHALVDYGKHANPGASSGRVTLDLDRKRSATFDVTAKSRLKTAVIPAASLPKPGTRAEALLSAPKGSSLRYTARLRWASSVAGQTAVDRGFAVKRELLDARSGKPVAAPSQGQLLRVRLTVSTPEERSQVALVDRLPAGFEAVDTALATSAKAPGAAAGASSDWVWRELHDERVTHFADQLPAGTHVAEYLVRATRTGRFLRPAASVEAMYAPDIYGHGSIETLTVTR